MVLMRVVVRRESCDHALRNEHECEAPDQGKCYRRRREFPGRICESNCLYTSVTSAYVNSRMSWVCQAYSGMMTPSAVPSRRPLPTVASRAKANPAIQSTSEFWSTVTEGILENVNDNGSMPMTKDPPPKRAVIIKRPIRPDMRRGWIGGYRSVFHLRRVRGLWRTTLSVTTHLTKWFKCTKGTRRLVRRYVQSHAVAAARARQVASAEQGRLCNVIFHRIGADDCTRAGHLWPHHYRAVVIHGVVQSAKLGSLAVFDKRCALYAKCWGNCVGHNVLKK